MGHALKKVVSSLLIICFLLTDLSPALADTTSKKSNVAFDPTIFTSIDPDKFTLHPNQLSQEEVEEARKFLEVPTRNFLEVMFLLKNLNYRIQMEEERLGQDEVEKIIAKRKDSQSIEFEVEKVGKAEPLVIHTERGPLYFDKVRHNELKMPIFMIDKNKIDLQFLLESERLQKLKLGEVDKTLQNLSPQQVKDELKNRKFILNHMRTLYARMLMTPWNPEFQYQPLSEVVQKGNAPETTQATPEEVEKQVKEVMTEPVEKLQHKNWFKRLASKSYDTWIDLAKTEQSKNHANTGNEAIMVILYDGNTGKLIESQTIKRPSKFSYEYWRMYARALWEPPAYGKPVWKNNTGLGKLRVLLTGDYLMGLTFGMALGSLSFLVSSALPGSLPEGLNAFDVARISFGWSLFFGVFGKTWANFVYRGNDFVRFVKNWSTGLGQSYHFNLVSNESLSLLAKNGSFDPNALKIHGDIVVNQSIKTVTKTSLQEIPRTRAKTGEAEGTLKIPYYKIVAPWKNNMKFMELEATETTIDPLRLVKWLREQVTIEHREPRTWEEKLVLRFDKDFKIKLPWLVRQEYETYIPRQNFENQTPQFVTTPVGLLSRFGFTTWGIPLGHLLYAVLGPIGEVRQIRYKAKYADQLARNYGESHPLTKRYRNIVKTEIEGWNNLKIFDIPGTQFIGYYVKVVPVQVWKTAQELSAWVTKQAAYYTYSIAEQIKKQDRAANNEQKASQEQTKRMNLLMTVQTPQGKPHPQQIQNGIRFHAPAMCARLFQ